MLYLYHVYIYKYFIILYFMIFYYIYILYLYHVYIYIYIYHIYTKIHTSMLSCFCHSLITPEFGWLYPQFQSLWPRASLFQASRLPCSPIRITFLVSWFGAWCLGSLGIPQVVILPLVFGNPEIPNHPNHPFISGRTAVLPQTKKTIPTISHNNFPYMGPENEHTFSGGCLCG